MYFKFLMSLLLLSCAANAKRNCAKYKAVVDDNGECDCAPFLNNLQDIMTHNGPDYDEYCYRKDPVKWQMKMNFIETFAVRCFGHRKETPSPYYCAGNVSVGKKVNRQIKECFRKNFRNLGITGVYMYKNGLCQLFCQRGYYGRKCQHFKGY